MAAEERPIVVARVQGKKSDNTFEDIGTDDAGKLLVWDPKVGSLISYTGTTTADGAPLGASLIDDLLVPPQPDFDGHLVVITSGAFAGQARWINGTTLAGTVIPNANFGGVILTGVTFTIFAINVAAAMAAFNVPGINAATNVLMRDVIGNKEDTATLDDMSLLATSSLVRDIKRILLRMSPDAFTADIQGAARTELDTMLAQLATYFVAAGAAMGLQINGNAARTNLQQSLTDLAAVFGADGANIFNPTIQGAARTDLDTALNILATYLTAAGAAMSIQVNGNAVRDNLEQAFEDLTAVFGANGANVFNPTIQGVGQTDLDAALAQLAIYFAAAGAAMSIQVNGGAVRANLELVLEDYFAVVGCDGANIFSTTIQGVARTTIEAAFDGLAAYVVAAGAALSVTIDPGGAARTSLATLWNDLGQMLAGAAGITTWPAAAPPGNGVSLAEAIRQIYNDLAAVETKLDAGGLGSGKVTKALTFANQVGQVSLFTVTGDVIVRLVAVVKGNCGTFTACLISVGIAADVDAIIPVTDITLLAAQEIWFDATPDSEIEALGTMREHIISDGNDITLNSSAADNSGAITFYCFWTALSAGATVVAA